MNYCSPDGRIKQTVTLYGKGGGFLILHVAEET